MEKIFTPNRWFVLFCALLIVVFGTLKIVGDMNVANIAAEEGTKIFTWTWPGLNWQSTFVQVHPHVLTRNEHDALVEVSGRQIITGLDEPAGAASTQCDAKALLTLYRLNGNWELGKVELK